MQLFLSIILFVVAILLFVSKKRIKNDDLERAANIGGIIATLAALIVFAFYTSSLKPNDISQGTLASTATFTPTFLSVVYNTETPTPTITLTPTYTPPLPTLTFTATIIPPTFTLTPAFNEQGKQVPLKDGAFVKLMPDFTNAGGACMPPNPGFTVGFEINIQSQFLLRYDTSGFHAEDDLGNKYELVTSGLVTCPDPPGIVSKVLYGRTWLYLKLKGQSPLTAQYIIITIDSLSGVGPLVFHKSF